MLKTLLISLYIALSLSGCADVPIKDTTVCANLGSDGAHCNNTLTEKPVDYSALEWQQKSVGWLCMNSDDFNNTETAVDQLCQICGNCTYQTKEAFTRMLPLIESARKSRK